MNWKVELAEIEKKKRFFLEGEFEQDGIDLDIGYCKFLEPVKVKMVVAKTKDGFTVGGYVRTVIEHPCDRCLEPTRVEINGVIEALYLPESMRKNVKEEKLESLKNIIYYHETEFDLSERIIEAIVVAVPDKVLCSPDCKGLCPYCGVNLNEEPDHRCDKIPVVDSRFEILEKLKKNLESKEV
ncbi:DUF177 domain-containing protein [Thermotoga sp. KOL6]|uniref:YceD family protein n=1 Tax=Thermotoga sp. KOL6 TaxID=126741 RepID=UPI000C76BED2|nr:YceD family protein [Thermotoga sp. KOL6]PLV58742.1 DNA-binding protein [Thermotoga sp. KOL6]